MGDIMYSVTREFWGNVEMVGESIAVNGKIHGNPNPDSGDAFADQRAIREDELGYFTMIDAVASEGIEGEKGSGGYGGTAASSAPAAGATSGTMKKGGYGIGSWKK